MLAVDSVQLKAADHQGLTKDRTWLKNRKMRCPCPIPTQGPPGPPGPNSGGSHNSLFDWDTTRQNFLPSPPIFQAINFNGAGGSPIFDSWTPGGFMTGFTTFSPNVSGRYYVTFRGEAIFDPPFDMHLAIRATKNGVEIPGSYAFYEMVIDHGPDDIPAQINVPITTSFIGDFMTSDILVIEFISAPVNGGRDLGICADIGTDPQLPTSASLTAILINTLP